MKYKLTFLSFALLISGCWGAGPTQCTVNDDTINWEANIITPPSIDDTQKLNLVIPFTGNVDVSTPDDSDSGKLYIEASINPDDSTILIITNDYFNQHIDEETASTTQDFVAISRTIVIKCDDTDYPLTLTQYVTDINNQAPTFSSDTYTYSMPMPLMPGVDLTSFGETVSIEDLDFSPQTIQFSVDPPDDFALETTSLGNKQYRAVLKATSYVRFDAGLTLTITASDGTNHDTATITITKDDSVDSLPDIPRFSEAFYEYTYSDSTGTPTITAVDSTKPVSVTTSNAAITTVQIDDDTYVTAAYDSAMGIVAIESSGKPIVPSSEQVLSLTLTVTLNGEVSHAGIIVKLPSNVVVSAPTFNQAYYTATYSIGSDTDLVTLDSDQVIGINENFPDVGIALSGDDHFSISNVGGVWTLSVSSDLEQDVLDQGDDIILTLHATITEDTQSYEGLGSVIVKLPAVLEVPRFNQAYYIGQYHFATDGSPDTVTLDNGPINIVQNGETVDVVISDTDVTNFKLVTSTDGWTVEVDTNLDPNLANSGASYVLSLQATVTGATTLEAGLGSLVINLPPRIEAPTFSEVVYEYTYSDDGGTPMITPVDSSKQILVTTSDSAATSVALDDATYVTATYEGTTDVVTIASSNTAIPSTSEQVLSLTLTVTLSGQSSHAAIVVALPSSIVISSPTFNQPYYTATYSTASTDHTVSLDPGQTIGINENFANVQISIDAGDDKFGISNVDGVWTLSVSSNLDQSVLDKGGDIILTLLAQVDDELTQSYEGLGTIVVKLPEVPRFTQATYEATYQVATDGGKDTVALTNGPIDIVQTDETVTISIVDTDNSFDLAQGTDGWTVTVSTNLDPDVVQNGGSIVLQLQSTVTTESVIDAFSTLVINLPPSVQVPGFNQPHYSATYDATTSPHSVTLEDGPILVTGDDPAAVNVTISPDSFPEKKSDYESKSLKAVPAPKFLKPLYNAEYSVDADNRATTTITDGPINVTDPSLLGILDFHLSGSYYEYFTFTLDGSPQIAVEKNLEDGIFAETPMILLTLRVYIVGSSEAESTVIAIRLPQVAAQSLKFNQPSFTFSYLVDTNPHSIDQKGQTISLTNGDSNSVVTITDGSYKDYFEVTQNPDDGTYEIRVGTALDQEILNSELDFLLILDAALTGFDDGFATVLINLPKKDSCVVVPQFTSSSYSADYILGQDSGSSRLDSLTISEQIGLLASAGNPNITLTGTLADMFKVVCNSDGTGCDIALAAENLDDGTLIGEADLVLTLQASVDGTSTVGESTLVIKLPKETAPASFSQPNYVATYTVNAGTDSLTLDNPIEISGNYLDETNVILNVPTEYKTYFSLADTKPTFDITVDKELDSSILTTVREIVLTLEASLQGSTLTTTSTVVIELPPIPKAPKFSNPIYTAKYEAANDVGTVTIDNPQITTDATDPSTVSMTIKDTYVTNFDISYDDALLNYQISVTTPLDDATITNNVEIYLILDATIVGGTDETFAIVAIRMPEAAVDVVPKFSEPFYYGTYTHNEDPTPDSIEIATATPINIISDLSSETAVTVLDSYSANFNPTSDGTTWQLDVVTKLDPITLANPEIVVTLQAELPGSPELGLAAVILSLPAQVLAAVPLFDHAIYNAEYTIGTDGTPSLRADPIAIQSAQKPLVDVILGSYVTNFNLERDDDTQEWSLSLGEPLDDATLKDYPELVIELNAHMDNSVADGAATLVVKLPAQSVVFDNDFYEGSYVHDTIQGESVSTDTITVTSGAVVAIADSEYKDSFEIACEDTTCTLTTSGLDEGVLNSQSEVILVLKATRPDVATEGTATLIISLPLKEALSAPEFTQTSYLASYADDGSGPVVTIQGQIQIKDLVDLTDISIVLDGVNKDYFTITPEDDHFIVDAEVIPPTVIDSEIVIVLTLQATKTGVTVPGESTLVIELPKKEASSGLQFENNVYMGDYSEDNGLVIPTAIKIVGDDSHAATIALSGDHSDLFQYTHDADTVTITLIDTPIPPTVIDANAALTITVTATADSETAEAALVVTLPKSQNSNVVTLTQITYTASYAIQDAAGDQVTVENGPITIKDVTDFTNTEIKFADTDPFKDFFSLTFVTDHWDLGVAQDLLAPTTDNEISLLLSLVVTVNGVSGAGSLVIKLPKSGVSTTFYFDETVYMSDYDSTNGFVVAKDLTLEGNGDGTATYAFNGEYASLFHAQYADKIVTITVPSPISQTILDANAAIDVEIVATRDTDRAVAKLVVRLPKTQSSEVVVLTQVAYSAVYNIQETDDGVTLENGPITITGVTDFTGTDIKIADDDPYKEFFGLTFDTDHWNLGVVKDLLPDTTDKEISLLLTLVATVNGVTGESGLVIKLPKSGVASSLYFDDTVYLSDYDQVNGLVVEKDLTLEGNDDGTATINLSGDHADLFKAEYANKIVTITVTNPISQDILDANVVLSLKVVVDKDSNEAAATLVVRLPKKGGSTISFIQVAFIGSYSVDNSNQGVVTLDNAIQLDSIDPTTVTLTIKEATYQPYFDFVVEEDHWLVNVKQNLPTIITDQVSVSITLIATINEVSGEAALVLRLPKKVVSTSYSFQHSTYHSTYVTNQDGGSFIEVEETIQIDDDPDGNVVVTLEGDYQQYFTSTYDQGLVNVNLLNSLPANVLDTSVLVNLDIVGSKGDERATATLIVTLPEKTTPVTFYFDETTYLADYEVSDASPSISVDEDILLQGDSDGTATVTLDGDYKDNFNFTYTAGKIAITLKSALPSDVVDSEVAISLDLKASRQSEDTAATLVIKLPKIGGSTDSGNSNTGLIAAVAVLAVLLVAAIVGSAVFYYFKFRRGKNYADLDEGRPSERFRKNSNNPESKRFEHPTRRPTGVIKYPLNDEVVGESVTDMESLAEKRKSVQFDTINIDEMEIEKSEDVEETEDQDQSGSKEDKEENEYENLDIDSDDNEESGDADIRRSSRV